MGFNLNVSRKPEYSLNENMIDEVISMYGLQCKWLYSEKINVDWVFNDFSHFKIEEDYKDIIIMPETSENWDGDDVFNSFGFFNQQTTNLFMSKATLLGLYPDFLENTGTRAIAVNSLLITPSSTILEVTHIESFAEGISNLWGYADNPSSYKLTCKVYTNNLSDENITKIDDSIPFEEGPDGEIFSHEEPINTEHIDDFFNDLTIIKDKQDKEGSKISKTGGVFGPLS